jgi:Protein of unknown function (DUF2933)
VAAAAAALDLDQKSSGKQFYLSAESEDVPMSAQDQSGLELRSRGGMSTKSKAGLVLIGFLLIGGVLMFTEHRAHVLGIFLWLPLVACPLMHVFMHGGHGHHGSHDRNQRGTT